ncbi:unnamed protein product [Didymodactylos carnosus]|uniref:Uncharacterized protein n=1 Tax=Didymodactylos carnosus TaxID=1234261 RepID=A0A814C6H3_9BILA|nr:unnamed protein product [Didymodactylos carnosus]CAF0935886.1 unnamed protein product [Didymodactylos carnosus]CAF3677273.1 unnamed protein product [Didymodactylos carnosus]CAF3713136.1 unnamed protein product [Didymodactylos carnosus]
MFSQYGIKFPTRTTKLEIKLLNEKVIEQKRIKDAAVVVKKPLTPKISQNHKQETPTTTKKRPSRASRKFTEEDMRIISMLPCSKEFSQFHKEAYVDVVKDSSKQNYLRQLALQTTKCYHLRNQFKNLKTEHLNMDQIKQYYHARLDEYRDFKKVDLQKKLDTYRKQVKINIGKWLKQNSKKSAKTAELDNQQ